jgi:NAD(P)-dependent dehydrogenase (short-subunit alcohol dehydrogenase family)
MVSLMTQSDIKRPTVLLTGPTSGIGARMLERLAQHPSRPNLVLLARDETTLAASLAQVCARGLTATGIPVDLSDLASVRTAVEAVAAVGAPIDAALLNAGAQFTSARNAGAQGRELTFTVNVIAQHLLLRGLEPVLAPAAHVIVMGSSTHRGKKASFNLVPDPIWREPAALAEPEATADGPTVFRVEREKGGVAYASSKLALVTLSHDWAERLAATGRRLNAYDPGLVPGTGLGKDMPGYMYWVWKNLMPAMRVLPGATTAANTARHAIDLALGDTFADLSDGYVEIGVLTEAEPVTFDNQRRAALWDFVEAEVREFLPVGAR